MALKKENVLKRFRMKTRALKELELSELLRLAKTEKGRDFLRTEVKEMELLLQQVRLALGNSQVSELCARRK